jgi:hypothetical protein
VSDPDILGAMERRKLVEAEVARLKTEGKSWIDTWTYIKEIPEVKDIVNPQ